MPCARSPVCRPAGRLVAMTACQGIVTAAPLNTELRQPVFLQQCAGRHCGGSDDTRPEFDGWRSLPSAEPSVRAR